jgi:hypothetical protein
VQLIAGGIYSIASAISRAKRRLHCAATPNSR